MRDTSSEARLLSGPLVVRHEGAGRPVVLVHGTFNDSRAWTQTSAALSSDHAVTRYDLRGHGQSPVPVSPFSHARDLASLLSGSGQGRAVLIGSSSGAGTALEVTLSHPELVRALVLVAPSVPGQRFPLRTVLATIRAMRSVGRYGQARAVEDFIGRPSWDYYFPSADAPHARELVLSMIRTPANFYAWDPRLAVPLVKDAASRLTEVAVPTLVVTADDDAPFNITAARRTAAQIPGAQLAELPGAGHLPFLEKPHEFVTLVSTFLATLPA